MVKRRLFVNAQERKQVIKYNILIRMLLIQPNEWHFIGGESLWNILARSICFRMLTANQPRIYGFWDMGFLENVTHLTFWILF